MQNVPRKTGTGGGGRGKIFVPVMILANNWSLLFLMITITADIIFYSIFVDIIMFNIFLQECEICGSILSCSAFF